MNKCVSIAIAIILGAAAAQAGEWVELFDGKSLEGWIQKNGDASYKVEDGMIVGTTGTGPHNAFLCTEEDYGDFELEFEVKLFDPQLNSGVQIRSKADDPSEPGGDFGRVNGPQVEIEATGANGSDSGYIYGEACGGWMTPGNQRPQHKVFKDGEWNKYRVVAKGPRIQTWINGQEIGDLTHEARFHSHPKGFIGLQVHQVGKRGPYRVAWRNIRIKPLD
jgi:hypothetical protein